VSLPYNTHKNLLENLEDYLRDTLNIKQGDRELVVKRIDMPSTESHDDLRSQKSAKIQGISYKKPVRATLELKVDNKTEDTATVTLLDLPQVTTRGTYIVEGNEYSFPLQKRLLPGVYTREKPDGTIEAWINSSKGKNLRLQLREQGDFVLDTGKKINLLALLVGLGIDRQRIRRVWGDEVYRTNKGARGAGNELGALKKLYDSLHYDGDEDVDKKDVPTLRRWLLNYFEENSELDPQNVEMTLGREASRVSADLFMVITKKILEVSRGESEEDNRESLIHNAVFDLSDFAIERLNHRQYRSKIARTLQRNLQKFDKVSDVVQKRLFQGPLDSTFTQTSLARIPKQNNPMDLMASFSEITSMGEGGIETRHAVSRETRAVDPSHLNFIDPMHTPEGQSLGTSLHLAKGVKKRGKDLVKKVWDVKKGEQVEVTPREMYMKPTAFAEYYKEEDGRLEPDDDGKIKVSHKGEISRVSPHEVRFAMRRTTDMFGYNSLGMPFLSHNNGTRGMTASKMQSQAKSLVHREVPKVQAAIDEHSGATVEQLMGKFSVPKAPVDGKVVKLEEDNLVIRDADGKSHKVNFPKSFWLNDHNFQDTEITVSKGDRVTKGQALGDTNYTKDGELALGTNLKTAYVPYKGLNHEDGVVVSETAAKKLTSMHAYQKTVPVGDNEVLSKKKYQAYFPSLYTADQLSKLDDDGVVKKGQRIKKGDPLVVKMRKVEEDTASKQLKNISRLLTQDFRDGSIVWDKATEGVVEEVHPRNDDVLVVVKTEERAKVGDKLVGRHGNKGTITTIIDDGEMPRGEDEEPLELLLNPNGVISRMNTGQIMEVTASNIANHDGKPYVSKPFGKNHSKEILDELKERGLKDHSTIYDPTEDKHIEGVLVGDHYTLKLEHKVDKKLSARGAGPGEAYSLSGQPSQGKGKGGRSIGLGEMYALLAHGADANLKEMYTFKGDKSIEHWRAIENGTALPKPNMPNSSKKFVSMLRGMGVNLEEDDKGDVKMAPFLDRHVRDISNGEIKDATALRAKDLKEEKGGLFDLETTGGLEGTKWSHIELAEPLPHPTFLKAIRDVTKLRGHEIDDLVGGKKGVVGGKLVAADKPGATTGGEGLRKLLKSIDPDKRLKEIKEKAPKASGSKLNKMHREARTLKNFKEKGVGLDEMVVDTIPVMPPKFRPVIELPGTGDISVADVNEHYRSTILMNNQLKALKGKKGLQKQRDKVRKSLFDGFSGSMGMSMGLVQDENVKGLAETVAGTNPKSGYFQKRLLKRRQDTSGTAVVGPDPDLDMDQIGVPEQMAWKIFKPHIKRELRGQGLTPLQAEQEIEDRTKLGNDALQRAMGDRHVMANRAPTLHKFSIMAFKPKLIPGHAVKLPVEVLGGFNADFDGDTFGIHVPATEEANKEAEDLLPSKNMYLPGRNREEMNPGLSHEYVLGLFKITRKGAAKSNTYDSPEEAIKAADTERIDWTDTVRISGIGKTTAGRCKVMAAVPEKLRDYNARLDNGKIKDFFKRIQKEEGDGAFKDTLGAWKKIAKSYAYTSGSSFLLSDMKDSAKLSRERDKLYADADRQVQSVRGDRRLSDEDRKKKVIDLYGEVDKYVKDKSIKIKGNDAGKSNNISDMVEAGARGNPDQVKQLVGSLGLMLNHRQETMEEPVRGNYAEGLSSSDYFAHLYSQRKGMIDKTQSVAGPGYLAKELTNSAADMKVTEKDCGTKEGRYEKVDGHLKDRVLADSVGSTTRGTVIDDSVLSSIEKLKKPKVKVRSILTCESTQGVCAKCFGYDETGSFPMVGKNVGISEVQALTERATQLPMKSFHTGGVATAETGLSNAFDRAQQILQMPENIKGKAVLAEVSGPVQKIKSSGYGGKVVVVSGKDHKIPQKLDVKVKIGERVKKGDPLSTGVTQSQDVLRLRGINDVQTQMRDDLHQTFSSAGVNLSKKNYEVTVKSLTDKVRVQDSGDSEKWVPGDYAKLPQVKAWNNQNPTGRQVTYKSVLPGAQQNPHKGDDWAQRMALSRIKTTIEEGGPQGFSSSRTSGSPFADLALGPGSNLVGPGLEAMDKMSSAYFSMLPWPTEASAIACLVDIEKAAGFTFEPVELDAIFEARMSVDQMIEKIAERSTPAEKERARRYYQENKDEISRKRKLRQRKIQSGVQRKRKRIGSPGAGYQYIHSDEEEDGSSQGGVRLGGNPNFDPNENPRSTEKKQDMKRVT